MRTVLTSAAIAGGVALLGSLVSRIFTDDGDEPRRASQPAPYPVQTVSCSRPRSAPTQPEDELTPQEVAAKAARAETAANLNAPEWALCPVSLDIMQDPVVYVSSSVHSN